jgi:hypothetical protein
VSKASEDKRLTRRWLAAGVILLGCSILNGISQITASSFRLRLLDSSILSIVSVNLGVSLILFFYTWGGLETFIFSAPVL